MCSFVFESSDSRSEPVDPTELLMMMMVVMMMMPCFSRCNVASPIIINPHLNWEVYYWLYHIPSFDLSHDLRIGPKWRRKSVCWTSPMKRWPTPSSREPGTTSGGLWQPCFQNKLHTWSAGVPRQIVSRHFLTMGCGSIHTYIYIHILVWMYIIEYVCMCVWFFIIHEVAFVVIQTF